MLSSLLVKRHPEAKELWRKIRNPNCEECPLHIEAQTVCLIGDGPVESTEVMVIGEAPGFREDDVGRPFAGRSGALLEEVLSKAGLNRAETFITNVAKCRPPENRTPTKTEIKACRHYLEAEIEAVNPKFIMTVGNAGLSLIRKSGITKHRGNVYEFNGALVMPTFHPAAILRNPRYEPLFRRDVMAFGRLVRGEESDISTRIFLVRSKKSLTALIQMILSADAVAYDFETDCACESCKIQHNPKHSGLEDWIEDRKPVTLAIAVKPGVAFVVPLHHPESPWGDPDSVLELIARALLFSRRRIAHNAKFDDKWLIRLGYPVYATFDTMIAAHLIDENQLKGLKPLAQLELGVDAWAVDTRDLYHKPLKDIARYNAKDADYTLRLYYLFRTMLRSPAERRTSVLFTKLLMPASRALTNVERNGIWVDKERLQTRSVEVQSRLLSISTRLEKLCGQWANWNSPVQLVEILFNDLKYPVFEMTKKGNPSTAESVMLRMKKHERSKCWCKGNKRPHLIAETILEWRQWSKNMSTYFNSWGAQLDANDRLHPNYKITGTVTGRLSSGKPEDSRGPGLNVQQIPRDPFIRGVIGAPPGWRFVEADFSQIELRIAAHYSQDPTLQRLYQLGQDVHMQVAVDLTRKPASEVTKEERKKAKAVNFGFLFGMGAPKFVEYAFEKYDLEISLEEAQQVRKAFFRKFSSLQGWHAQQRRLVRKYKRVQSLIGHTRHLPDIDSEDEGVRGEAERQAINSPVQGLASHLMLLSLAMLDAEMLEDEAKIVGTIHDSGLFEIREDVVEKWIKRIREVMENLPLQELFRVSISVPIVVDIRESQHWGDDD